jgi:hypothetical protein
VNDRYALTSLGKLALSVAKLERSWSIVPLDVQERVLAVLTTVAADYAPAPSPCRPGCPCDLCWDRADERDGTHTPMEERRGPVLRVLLVGKILA